MPQVPNTYAYIRIQGSTDPVLYYSHSFSLTDWSAAPLAFTSQGGKASGARALAMRVRTETWLALRRTGPRSWAHIKTPR